MTRLNISAADLAFAKHQIKCGATLAQAAELLGCSRNALACRLNPEMGERYRQQVKQRTSAVATGGATPDPPPSQEIQRKIVAMYQSGASFIEIRTRFGIGWPKVRWVLLQHGIQIRPKGRPSSQKSS